MAAITDILDQVVKQEGRKEGDGALPNALLARLRDLGVGRHWVITAQEQQGGVFVQICCYDPKP